MDKNEYTLVNGITLGMLGKLGNELCMIKAMQYVQLEYLAKEKNIELEILIKRVDKMFAQYVFDFDRATKGIIDAATNPDAPDSDLKDLF